MHFRQFLFVVVLTFCLRPVPESVWRFKGRSVNNKASLWGMISSGSFAHDSDPPGIRCRRQQKSNQKCHGVISTRRLSIAPLPWPIRSEAATGLRVTAVLATLWFFCASLTFSIEHLSHLCTCPVLPGQLRIWRRGQCVCSLPASEQLSRWLEHMREVKLSANFLTICR